VSLSRHSGLADRLWPQVRACRQPVRARLICTAGWVAYPNRIRRALREKVKTTASRGRARLQAWPEGFIATIIKRTEKKRVVEVTRRMAQGTWEHGQQLWHQSQGGTVLTTALIERLNGTMRQRLASLTRQCRHAAHRLEALETGMDLIGCTYHLCFAHHEWSHARHGGSPCTPAMASGFTAHIWSRWEVLTYKMAPAPWIEPQRRGRPRSRPLPDPTVPKRPRGRPRKVA
jgi:IS1 family transposase